MPATTTEHDLLTRLDSQVSDIRKLLWAIAGLAVAITAAAFYTAFEAGKGAEALASVRAGMAEVKGEVKGLRTEVADVKAEVKGLRAEIADVKAGVGRIEKALPTR